MEKRTDLIFAALFKLEEARQVIRNGIPGHLNPSEEGQLKEKISALKGVIQAPETNTGNIRPGKIAGTLDIRTREEDNINIQPIQAAGRLIPAARQALIAYGDGYSTGDACRKPFRIDIISKPPIADIHTRLAAFVNMDEARVVPGARRGFQAVVEKGDSVIVSALAHYTGFLAVEGAGGGSGRYP